MKESELEDLIAYELVQPHDDLLWQVAQGKISPEQAALRSPEDEDEDDHAQRVRIAELFAPSSADADRRIRDQLLAQRFSAPRSRWRMFAAVGGGVLAAAAAIVLAWFIRTPEGPGSTAPMPQYQARWVGQYTGDILGDVEPSADACERYKIDGGLEVHLKPREPTTEDPVVVAFATAEGTGREHGTLLTLVSPTVGGDGVLTIKQSVADLDLAVGRWTISFAIARELEAPAIDELRVGQPHPGVTWVESTVCIER